MLTFANIDKRQNLFRFLMLIGFMSVIGSFSIRAQTDTSMNYDKDAGHYYYKAAVAAPNFSADELFHNTMYYLKQVTDDKGVEQIVENKKIRQRVPVAFVLPASKDTVEAYFDLSLTFQDERYDYEISNISVRESVGNSITERALEDVLNPESRAAHRSSRDQKFADSLNSAILNFTENLRRTALEQEILKFNNPEGERNPDVHPREN